MIERSDILQVSPSLFEENVNEGTFTFLPLGPVPDQTLDEYRASVGAPPAQPVKYTHRFHLAQVASHVRNTWPISPCVGLACAPAVA